MKILKRADFWILLVLVGGLAAYLLHSQKQVAPAGGAGNPRFSVTGMSLKRDYANFVLALDFEYDNGGGDAFDPASEARLLGAGDRSIPGYFLATDARDPVPAGEGTERTLKFWLEAADLAGPLVLELRGERIGVKSAEPFDGEGRIGNQATVDLSGPDWH